MTFKKMLRAFERNTTGVKVRSRGKKENSVIESKAFFLLHWHGYINHQHIYMKRNNSL